MKRIPINRPSISSLEISYVDDAIRNGWGEKCYDYIYKFEADFSSYLGTKHAHATSSCTGALHLALMALGITAGDEVIIPEITWIASVSPVLYVGAKPVFVDVLNDTWCIDPVSIRNSITNKTKAIIVVHVYGNLCEMDEVMKIAKEFNLVVIEDAAEALGSVYKGKKAGSIGNVGVFSFHGTKTMTTGEGGLLVTNDSEVYAKTKILNDHGRNPLDPDNQMFWMRDFGYKYKMSNLQAALGCAQLNRIEELLNKKRENFYWYQKLLENLPCQLNPEHEHTKNSYWLPTVVFEKSLNFDRTKFFQFINKLGIDSRPFFFPLSMLPMFQNVDQNKIAYDVFERGINLPSYHDLEFKDAERIVEYINKFLYD